MKHLVAHKQRDRASKSFSLPARRGEIDLLITKSITRFARNTVTLLKTIRDLKSRGIAVQFEKENINTLSADGELMLALLASFAQEEARSVSENQKWKIQKSFEQGQPWSCTMLGYRKKDGQFEIIPEEAAIVQQIYTDYLSGMGFLAIAKKLEKNHVPTRSGGKWCSSTIRNILKNETYRGTLLLQKTYRTDFLCKTIHINHGEKRMYRVEEAHEAIIDPNLFQKVQEEIERRIKAFKPPVLPKTPYPFTSLIRCGNCGASYRHKLANHGSKYQKPVWICATFNTYGKESCSSQQIPESILVEKTCAVLGGTTLDESNLREVLKEIIVPAHNLLRYVFQDGHSMEVPWQNPSRRNSWTPERKAEAAKRQKQRIKQNKKGWGKQDEDSL